MRQNGSHFVQCSSHSRVSPVAANSGRLKGQIEYGYLLNTVKPFIRVFFGSMTYKMEVATTGPLTFTKKNNMKQKKQRTISLNTGVLLYAEKTNIWLQCQRQFQEY